MGGGAYLGLDYNAVQWVVDLMQVDDPLHCLDSIRCIERGACESLNK